MEAVIIDVSKDPELRKVWKELEKKFNEEVFRLREIAEEEERKAIARYGDPVINF